MSPEEFSARYEQLAHAIQTGVAYDQAGGSSDGSPKHLRVGVTLGRLEHAAIARLCMAAGVFTEAQYFEAVLAELATEKERYEAMLKARYGGKTQVRLG